MSLRKNAVMLFGLRILKTISSVAILSLSAYFFGVSVERDIWILAFTSILVIDLAIWGPVNETVRTKFIFLKEQEGETGALKRAASLVTVTSVVSLFICLGIILFPQLLARIIAPAYYETHLPVLIFMIRVIAPTFLINQLSQLAIGVLNAYHSFYMPEIAGLISSFLNIIMLIVLVPFFGIYSLVFSYYLSLLVLFVLVLIQIRKLHLPLKISYFSNISISAAGPFFLFALPFFLPYFAGQVNVIAEKSIANLLGNGTVSLIDYSRKFIDIPINALSAVLITLLLPVLSGFFSVRETGKFVSEFKRVLQLGLLVLTVVIGVLFMNAFSIVSILYGSDKISDSALQLLTRLVQLYSLSGFSVFLYSISGIGLIASNKGKYYAFYGVVAQLLMLGINLILHKSLGVMVFPVSLFVSHLIAAIFLLIKLPAGRREVFFSVSRYTLFLLLTLLISFFITSFTAVADSHWLSLIINSALLLGIGIALIFLLRMEERGLVINFIRKAKPLRA